MYKMKEVCERTGLSEKTVRFYVEQKLVEPRIIPGLHYKSYTFSEAEIRRLQDVAALRNASFTVTEIRTMLEQPEIIPAMVAQKEAQLGQQISGLQAARTALQNLTVQEHTDFSRIADAIEPRSVQRKETPANTHNRFLWLLVYVVLFLIMGLAVTGGKQPWLVFPALLILAGLWFPGMGICYYLYNRRGERLPCRTQARVISVISDEGISEYWPSSGGETVLGLLNVGFLHWDWVRPDHWIPLLQFEADGKTITTAYRYGGLKNSWQPGSCLEISWEPGKELQVYPIGDRVIRIKAAAYFISGLLSLAIGAVVVCKWLGVWQ